MAENLSIESPDFDRIKKGNPKAIEDAVRLLWLVLNEEMKQRRSGIRRTAERMNLKVVTFAPSANQNNVDTEGAGLVVFTGSSAVNVTGYRAPSVDGAVLVVHVTGSATITHQDQHASSDATNRMVFQAGADKAVATNKSLILMYQNTRWREWSAA